MGGLRVVGTERHEARRIDNQLRGRAGRQGDPGSSVFFLSLEDDLMRIFAKDWVSTMLQRMGMQEGEEIRSPMVSRMIEKVQRKMEAHHFEIRKNVLEYDGVMDHQRKVIYGLRQSILEGQDTRSIVMDMLDHVVKGMVEAHLASGDSPADPEALALVYSRRFEVPLQASELKGRDGRDVVEDLLARARARYEEREKEFGLERMRAIERFLVLSSIDEKWKDHLYAMDALRSGIGLKSYAQEDPKVNYRIEGMRYFETMLGAIRDEVTEYAYKIQIPEEPPAPGPEASSAAAPVPGGAAPGAPAAPPAPAAGEAPPPPPRRRARPVMDLPPDDPMRIAAAGGELVGPATRAMAEAAEQSERGEARKAGNRPEVRRDDKVGRNDPCPCGSGKKYKKCHGRG
jgi:preprotein translocase subunit SecA